MDDDGAETRRRLEAVAYGRGAGAAERDAALAHLRRLDAVSAVATLPEPPARDEDPYLPPARRRRRWIVIGALAAVAVAAAIVFAVIPRPPQSSLSVFDRAQTGDDLRDAQLLDGASPATTESVRALSSGESWTAFAYRDPAGRVCLGVVTAGALSLACVSRDVFAVRGVGITADYVDRSSVNRVGNFHWGPTGALLARISRTTTATPDPYPIDDEGGRPAYVPA